MKPVRRTARFLLLPAILILALSLAIGPTGWRSLYAAIEGFCRMHFSEVSTGEIILATALFVALIVVLLGVVTAAKHLSRLKSLSEALSRSGVQPLSGQTGSGPVSLVNEDAPFAFCHGFIRPRIYVSAGLVAALSERELQAVILHEQLHVRRRDPLKVFVAHTLAGALALIPLAKVLRDIYLLRLEVEADRATSARSGVDVLASALLKLLGAETRLAGLAPVSRFSPTEERIERLLNQDAQGDPRPLLARRFVLINAVWALAVGIGGLWLVDGVTTVLAAAPYCPMPTGSI